mgnify:CR=1 FL=1
MQVSYKGMTKDYDFRVAEINYDDVEEYEKVEEMIKIMNKTGGWNIVNGVAGCASCQIENKSEYREFMKDWKASKKELKER